MEPGVLWSWYVAWHPVIETLGLLAGLTLYIFLLAYVLTDGGTREP